MSIENVINLIVLDKKYSRSLTYQFERIQKDINQLPHSKNDDGLTECQSLIAEANSIIKDLNIDVLVALNEDYTLRVNLEDSLSKLSDLLHKTSLSISDTYFNHSYQQIQLANQNFPIQ